MINAIRTFKRAIMIYCGENHRHNFIRKCRCLLHMGQHEVIEFLRNNPDRWFSSREISDGIAPLSFPTTVMALKRMRENAEMDFVGSGRMGDRYLYKFKE